MAPITAEAIGYAFIGGFVPSFIWLYFWLKEDCHPEPKHLLLYSFLAGIASIPATLILEIIWRSLITQFFSAEQVQMTLLIIGWAFIEEVIKFAFVYGVIFWRRDYDEPVDAMVYLMTAALGFASLENVLYLSSQFAESFYFGITTGNLRFIGATLLHALASGVLGFYVAHSFCRNTVERRIGFLTGIILATLLHAAFNFLMLSSLGQSLVPVLVLLSVTGMFIIFAFEHIKSTHQQCAIHT